jgi:hypothetical protein
MRALVDQKVSNPLRIPFSPWDYRINGSFLCSTFQKTTKHMDLLSVVSSGIKLPNAQSIGVVLVLHAVSVLLTLIVPGPPFKGSPLKNNRPSIIYKMNGLRVQLLAILLFIACSNWGLGLYDISIIYNNYGAVLTTTVIYSFIFSTVLFVRAKYWIPKVLYFTQYSHCDRKNVITLATIQS